MFATFLACMLLGPHISRLLTLHVSLPCQLPGASISADVALSFQFAWLLFGIIHKSVVLQLLESASADRASAASLPALSPTLMSGLETLYSLLLTEVTALSTSGLARARALNTAMAVFIRDLFGVAHRRHALRLLRMQLSAEPGKGLSLVENTTVRFELRFACLAMLSEHDYFLAFCGSQGMCAPGSSSAAADGDADASLPDTTALAVTTHGSGALPADELPSDFLFTAVLETLFGGIDCGEPAVRRAACKLLRRVLTAHAYDARLELSNRYALGDLYLPLIELVVNRVHNLREDDGSNRSGGGDELDPAGRNRLTSRDRSDVFACVAWVLQCVRPWRLRRFVRDACYVKFASQAAAARDRSVASRDDPVRTRQILLVELLALVAACFEYRFDKPAAAAAASAGAFSLSSSRDVTFSAVARDTGFSTAPGGDGGLAKAAVSSFPSGASGASLSLSVPTAAGLPSGSARSIDTPLASVGDVSGSVFDSVYESVSVDSTLTLLYAGDQNDDTFGSSHTRILEDLIVS